MSDMDRDMDRDLRAELRARIADAWRPVVRESPPDVAAAQLAGMLAEAVPVCCTGAFNEDEPDLALPYVHLDSTRRPDLTDLLRVLEVEGPGRLDAEWLMVAGPARVVVRAEFETPVRCRFAAAFTVAGHRPLLEMMATVGCLGILPSPTCPGHPVPPEGRTFWIPCPTDALAAFLAG